MRVADRIAVSPARAVTGELRVPGDKSISHRYALLSAIADGRSFVANYAPGADCASTLDCIAALGAIVSRTTPQRDGEPAVVTIDGRGLRGLTAPAGPLDCGNSGSTMRMLSGVLAAHPFVIDPDRRRITLPPPDAADHRAAHPDGRRRVRGGRAIARR